LIFLLGIDDTGSPGQAGTDATALALGLHLQAQGVARLTNISSHQLIPAEAIPGSSQNFASCLRLEGEGSVLREIDLAAREYLRHHSAAGSNPGFALAPWERLDQKITAWGKSCQSMEMDRQEAMTLARSNDIAIAGFTGSGSGVIGALAAIGLRYFGNDGWITWMPGLPTLHGEMTFSQVLQTATFDIIRSIHGRTPAFTDRIRLGEKVYPLLVEGKTVLLLEGTGRSNTREWDALGIKARSRINW
jgi:hypothetical protein